jgi:hypothetical protein
MDYRAGDRLVRAAIRDVAFDSDGFDALTRPGASPRVRYDRGSPGNAVLAAQHELVQPALWTLGVLAWIALVAAVVGSSCAARGGCAGWRPRPGQAGACGWSAPTTTPRTPREPRDNGLVVVRLDSGLVPWPRGRCTAKV